MTVAPAQSPTDQAELLAMAYTLSRLSKLLCHEINQPLNTISITAHNGKRQAQDGSHPIADTHSRFDRIGQEVRRAGALVHALADLASPGATPAGILVPGFGRSKTCIARGFAVAASKPTSPSSNRWVTAVPARQPSSPPWSGCSSASTRGEPARSTRRSRNSGSSATARFGRFA